MAECWTLAYDHCIPGHTSTNGVPRPVVYNEARVRATGAGSGGRGVGAGAGDTGPAVAACSRQPICVILSASHALLITRLQYISLPLKLNAPQVLAGLFLSNYASGSFGSPGRLPTRFTRVCVPNPDAADVDACKAVRSSLLLRQLSLK